MKKNLRLFARFFMIGLLTFGGGYSMIPMFERELVEREHWITRDEMMDYFAISQCTPGVIAVNCATFVGNKVNGFFGAVFATVGVVTPSLIIITVIAAFLTHFNEYPVVIYAFNGIKIAVAALIISAVFKLIKSAVKDTLSVILYIAVFVCSLVFDVSPLVYVLSGIAISVIMTLIASRKAKKGGDAK